MSNIIIPREHQSAPKETEADKAVREAADDIRTGRFTPTLSEDDATDDYIQSNIGLARGGLKFTQGKLAEFGHTMEASRWLAQHPKVAEAMTKLQAQAVDTSKPEYLEKAAMLHELNAMVRAKGQWDGQGRWQGRENEEARLVNILHPFEFIRQLRKKGKVKAHLTREEDSRVWLGHRIVGPNIGVTGKSGLVGVYALLTGQAAREAHWSVIKRVEGMDLRRIGDPRELMNQMAEFHTAVAGLKSNLPAAVRVAALQAPYGPEWSLWRFDEFDCPTQEKHHGWRTALLGLVLKGAITVEQAHDAFGAPEGPASEFYREQLQQHRQMMIGQMEMSTEVVQ